MENKDAVAQSKIVNPRVGWVPGAVCVFIFLLGLPFGFIGAFLSGGIAAYSYQGLIKLVARIKNIPPYLYGEEAVREGVKAEEAKRNSGAVKASRFAGRFFRYTLWSVVGILAVLVLLASVLSKL